jgi:hypothetical protein
MTSNVAPIRQPKRRKGDEAEQRAGKVQVPQRF